VILRAGVPKGMMALQAVLLLDLKLPTLILFHHIIKISTRLKVF
jgi:hypothetical protein